MSRNNFHTMTRYEAMKRHPGPMPWARFAKNAAGEKHRIVGAESRSIFRRNASKYPTPVASSKQERANARRVRQGAL